MVFAETGDYLAVKVTRHTKSKKTFYNNIELFRLNDVSDALVASGQTVNVPVEMLDIQHAVMALQWEPNHGASRFAMIHAENPNASKVNVSIYDMIKTTENVIKKGNGKTITQTHRISELHKVETMPGKQCNTIFWSPAGSMLLMASLGDSASGSLEFYNVDAKTLVAKEHYRANQVLWDPVGRSVATCVTQPLEGGHFKFAMDNGFILWSFQGKQLHQRSFQTFYQFLWRPRPEFLSPAEREKVQKNWKKYEEQFDAADRKRELARQFEETAGKRADRADFRAVRDRNRALARKRRAKHITLLDGYDSDDEKHYVVVDRTIETVLTSTEELVM